MDIRGINLNLLVTLDALLEERGVTAAARRCGVSQPAMSHSLAQLRGLFDDPLVVRGGLLTPLAESLRGRLRSGLAELQTVLDTREPFDPSTSDRTFRIAASDAFAIISLHALLDRLAARAPRVNVVIRPADAGTMDALASGSVDLVAGSVEQSPGPDAVERELYRERFVCIVRQRHPAVRTRLGIATYARLSHALVAIDEEPGAIDRALARLGRTRRVALRVPDFAAIGHVIASSDLVATIPERLARRLAETLPLRILPPPLELRDFPVSLYWHRRFEADSGSRFLRGLFLELADAGE